MKQWMSLALVGILCIGIWSILLYSLLQSDTNGDRVNDAVEDLKIVESNHDISATEPLIVEDQTELSEIAIESNNDETEVKVDRKNFADRGIWPGDFADIAPNKLISIDTLLKRIKGEE